MQHLQCKRRFLSNLSIDLQEGICYHNSTVQKGGNNMNWAAIVWLVLLVLFIGTEASTVTVTSIWFAVGALAAMIASLLGAELWLQVVLFLVISVGLLLSLRPLTKKHFTPKLTRTNVDAVIGTKGVVTATIDNISSQGKIKLGAMEWTARSSSGEKIEAGTQVTVDRIEGVKAFVTPVAVETKVQ